MSNRHGKKKQIYGRLEELGLVKTNAEHYTRTYLVWPRKISQQQDSGGHVQNAVAMLIDILWSMTTATNCRNNLL